MPVRGGGGGGGCKTYDCPGYVYRIDACPGCTLKPVRGGVDRTDACPTSGDFTYCPGGGGGRLQLLSSVGVYA